MGFVGLNPLIGSLGADPNASLFAAGLTYFDRAFLGKLRIYYEAPHGFRIGSILRYYDGLPFSRLLFVNGFNQGPFFVRAMPYNNCCGVRTQSDMTVDLRIQRDFELKKGTASVLVDIFNLPNFNRDTFESDLTSPLFLKRVPLSIQPPRLARLGFEWAF